jgi:hypothetical protein
VDIEQLNFGNWKCKTSVLIIHELLFSDVTSLCGDRGKPSLLLLFNWSIYLGSFASCLIILLFSFTCWYQRESLKRLYFFPINTFPFLSQVLGHPVTLHRTSYPILSIHNLPTTTYSSFLTIFVLCFCFSLVLCLNTHYSLCLE